MHNLFFGDFFDNFFDNFLITFVILQTERILENVLAELKQFDSNWSNYEVWLGPSLQQKSHLVDLQFLKFFDSKYIKPLPKGQFVVDNQELFKGYLTRNNYIEADLKNIQSGYLDLHQYIKDKLVKQGFNISGSVDFCGRWCD